MLSPFPGMNPYIEDADMWEGFHLSLANEIQYQLAPQLRPRYIATLVPRVDYDEVTIESTTAYWIKPDVSVVRVDDRPMPGIVEVEAIAPAPLVALEEAIAEYNIEIREVKTGMVVTAIEIIAPVNQRPHHEAFEAYQRKRRDLRRAGVHLLEIDLLRGGERVVAITPAHDAHYVISLRRAGVEGTEIWPIQLQKAIPVVPVPLLAPDRDVPLNLGKAIHAIYDRAAYDLRIDYSQPPPKPELSSADAQWLEAHLQAAGLRPPVQTEHHDS